MAEPGGNPALPVWLRRGAHPPSRAVFRALAENPDGTNAHDVSQIWRWSLTLDVTVGNLCAPCIMGAVLCIGGTTCRIVKVWLT